MSDKVIRSPPLPKICMSAMAMKVAAMIRFQDSIDL